MDSVSIYEVLIISLWTFSLSSYEKGLVSVFSECNKKLKSNGFLIFSFHDKNIINTGIRKKVQVTGIDTFE